MVKLGRKGDNFRPCPKGVPPDPLRGLAKGGNAVYDRVSRWRIKGHGMSTPDSFIDEVTEEVRRDRLYALLRKYGWVGIAVVVAIVGWASWTEYPREPCQLPLPECLPLQD